MAKFKGRSTLKQFLPLKPIKRGIKIWMRCDAKSGYTYDLNIYKGKEEICKKNSLGERVVKKLASTIKSSNVVLAFDRFFTSAKLLVSIDFPAVGTYMSNRRNVPIFNSKLKRGEYEFRTSDVGLCASRWMDSKEVLVMSNCHSNVADVVNRKMKDGSSKEFGCPIAIADYNKIMGGVDLADQKAAVYDINRKSTKWWKKVFFKLLMLSVVNSWIIHQAMHRQKTTLIVFLTTLAEKMIEEGTKNSKRKPKSGGRPAKNRKARQTQLAQSSKGQTHWPIKAGGRKRCIRCT
jgi:hypothetical protein